jgi:peptide/nickel transport system substrate-binding protein
MRYARRLLLIVCFAALTNGSAWAGKANDTLVAAFLDGVRTLDGNYSNSRENDILGLLIDDALFAVDPKTARPVPLAAKSHEFRDSTTLVVELRDDVLFHDGSKMTAEDVVYSYRWLLDPRGKTNFYPRFRRWLASVDAEGPSRVVFRMKEPYFDQFQETIVSVKKA